MKKYITVRHSVCIQGGADILGLMRHGKKTFCKTNIFILFINLKHGKQRRCN